MAGEKRFLEKDYNAWKRYEMDAGEAFFAKGTARPKEIEAFVKDSYELPMRGVLFGTFP